MSVGNRSMIARRDRSSVATASKKRGRLTSTIMSLLVVLAAVYGLGLMAFLVTLPQPPSSATPRADGIVALTGEGDRLGPAVTLLEKGNGKRLLITGVNKLTSKRSLKTLLHGGTVFDCCADLGFTALDTRGNAAEAARWARAHNYKSLLVVTADYHMPRSLAEFEAQMPEVQLLPYPIVADAGLFSWQNVNSGLFSWQSVKRINGEYVKYLASMARISLAGLMRNA